METSALTEVLEKVQSGAASGKGDGLDLLQQWLQDAKNLARADTDVEIYPAIVRVLLHFMRSQMVLLSKGAPGRKSVTFKMQGAILLQQSVRLCHRCARTSGFARLARVQQRIWGHIDEALHCEAVISRQPGVLPYYCRIVRELAENSRLGYLSDFRGEVLRRRIRALLQLPQGEAQATALDAVAVVFRNVNGDPAAEVPWVCDIILTLLRVNSTSAVGCLAAVALRCPLTVRDWLVTGRNAEDLFCKASTAWSPKTFEGLEVVLRMAMSFEATILPPTAGALLPLASETLDTLVRSEISEGSTAFCDEVKPPRIARLSELLASLIAFSACTTTAMVERVCLQFEHRGLPWVLASVRLCEGRAHILKVPELVTLLDALSQLMRTVRRSIEVTAVHSALACAVGALAHSQVQEHQLRNVPVHLSCLSADGAVSPLVTPAFSNLRLAWCDDALSAVTKLVSELVSVLMDGIIPRSLYRLLTTIFIVAPPPLADSLARQFLALQAPTRASSSIQLDAAARCCMLEALRLQPADVAMQRELIQGMATESVDVRVAFLKLCEKDGSLAKAPPNIVGLLLEDDLCVGELSEGEVAVDPEPCTSSTSIWQRHSALHFLRRWEYSLLDAALDRSTPGTATAESIADDLRVHAVMETLAFRPPLPEIQLGSSDLFAHCTVEGSRLGESPSCAAACASMLESFTGQARIFCATSSEDIAIAAGRAVSLLRSMCVVLHLPRGGSSESFWQCLHQLFDLAVKLVGGAVGPRGATPVLEGLRDLIDTSEVLGLPAMQKVEVSQFYVQEHLVGLLEAPDIAPRCAALAEAVSSSWSTSAPGHHALAEDRATPEFFEVRGSSSRPRERVPRSCTLRLLISLACMRGASVHAKKAHARTLTAMQQLFAHVAQTEPVVIVPALRLLTFELLTRKFPNETLELAAEECCRVPDPAASYEFEELLLCALRLSTVAARTTETLGSVLRLFWCPSQSKNSARLASLAQRWRGDLDLLSSRGKLLFGSLLTHTLRLQQGHTGLDAVTEVVADHCSSTVPDLILKDRSCEVRLGVGVGCTKTLFDLFDDEQVFEEFQPLFQRLAAAAAAGGPVTSESVSAVQTMIEVASVTGYTGSVLCKLCGLSPTLYPTVRLALRALDQKLIGKSRGGAPSIAYTFRTLIFLDYVRHGNRLSGFPLADLCLELPPRPPRQGLGMHLSAAVAALVLSEELGQIGDLAPLCGCLANSPQFFEMTFVALAGTLLPLRQTLEPLRARYGEKTVALCHAAGHRVLGFSLQLPFFTVHLPHPLKGQQLQSAFEELDPQLPWANFKRFVSRHFRFLLSQLDRVLAASARWFPAVAVDLMQSFVSWLGPLDGSRFRLLLPTLVRHGLTLPVGGSQELCTLVGALVSSTDQDVVRRLALHQDESIRQILSVVEAKWGVGHSDSLGVEAAAGCPALHALLAVLRKLRLGRGTQAGELGAEWLDHTVEAMLSRLALDAQHVLAKDMDGARAPKRQRTQEAGGDSLGAALQLLSPMDSRLDWGPRPAPDLGALARLLLGCRGHDRDLRHVTSGDDGMALGRVFRLLAQPQMAAQMQRDGHLACEVARGLSVIDPAGIVRLGFEHEGEALESVLSAAMRSSTTRKQPIPSINELMCCAVLLGATSLQVHAQSCVRQLALGALQCLAGQGQVFDAACNVLKDILDPQHVCLKDVADLQPADARTRAAFAVSQVFGADPSWNTLHNPKVLARGFGAWVQVVCTEVLSFGSHLWDGPAKGLLLACGPLVRCVDWFAERVLIFAILKAADHPMSAEPLAQALNTFFRLEHVEAKQAQCILRVLHFVRLFKTGKLQRAVPYFPAEKSDTFWSSLDFCAVSESASRVGWPSDGLLYLELHLARQRPDLPIDRTLLRETGDPDELFRPPSREVLLLHRLAKQLPGEELLFGVSQWCHASSRLVRAELGQDHLAALHLRSNLREASLQGTESAFGGSHSDLDDALARLGIHTVLANEMSDSSTDAWEHRMEALWRLQQWDTTPGADGFHARTHGALSALAQAPQEHAAAVATLDGPLVGMVSQVIADTNSGAPEQLREGAVRLQMLGSIFTAAQVVTMKSGVKEREASLTSMAESWMPRTGTAASPQSFSLLEPLYAMRGAILAIAAPSAVQLRYFTSTGALAREAGQVHRALGLLERAHRVADGAPRLDVLRLRVEQARCFWDLKQQHQALSIAAAVAAECRRHATCERTPTERSWMARVLSDTGVWLSASRLESLDNIRKEYLEPAVTMDPADAQPRRQLADFLDAQLSGELQRQSSLEHVISRDLRRRTQAELEAAQKEALTLERARAAGREAELKQLKDQVRVLEGRSREDKQREAEEQGRLKTLALHCVQQYGLCLAETGTGSMTKVACRFLSLWFDYGREYSEITASVKQVMPRLCLIRLTPFIYQLASRMGGANDPLQETLEELLVRIGAVSADALWPLFMLRNGDKVPKDMRGADRFEPDKAKILAAKRVLEKLRQHASVRGVIEAVELLSKFYITVAFFTVDKKNRDTEVPLSTIAGYSELQAVLKCIPVPTAEPPVQGGPKNPCIDSFTSTFGIAPQGLSAPRILKLRDTHGNQHKQCVKGMDDVRQDAVIQQLFRLLNELFVESREDTLRLRTFQVVPLSPCAGIMEWVLNTVTLGEMLTGNTSPQEGAHHRYFPSPLDWDHQTCRKHMQQAAMQGSADKLQQAFLELRKHFRPVMHLVFLERFPSPMDWHRARLAYARSAAVSSMVGYIVGIGDRHPNNILFDTQTAEVVHIDFGIVFDQGKALRVPELVPFRLTRDMVSVLGCLGTCGPFKHCCEATMAVLRNSSPLVTAIIEVFVHDPVYIWSLSPRKARQADLGADHPEVVNVVWTVAAGGGASASGNEMARRALLALKGKLHGERESSAALGVSAHVGWLIHEAVETANLSRMYFGWSPWL